MKKLILPLTVTLCLALVAPSMSAAGDDTVKRTLFALTHPSMDSLEKVFHYDSSDALDLISRVARRRPDTFCSSIEPEVIEHFQQRAEERANFARSAITERDLIIAVLIEKYFEKVQPEFYEQARRGLAAAVDSARRLHTIQTMPLAK